MGAAIEIEQALKGAGVGEETELHLYDQLEDVEKWRDGRPAMVLHDRPPIVVSDPKQDLLTSATVWAGSSPPCFTLVVSAAGAPARTEFRDGSDGLRNLNRE